MTTPRATLTVCAVITAVFVGALAAYLEATAGFAEQYRYYLYPLVWLLVATVVVLRVSSPEHRSPIALAVATGYLLLLAVVAGTVSFDGGSGGWMVQLLPPGWGPLIAYDGTVVSVAVVPFQTVGHLSLAYLVFVAIERASESTALVGLVGLTTCVGCVWPVAAALLAAFSGGVSLAAVGPFSYDLATALYLLTALGMYGVLLRAPSDTEPAAALSSPTGNWRQ